MVTWEEYNNVFFNNLFRITITASNYAGSVTNSIVIRNIKEEFKRGILGRLYYDTYFFCENSDFNPQNAQYVFKSIWNDLEGLDDAFSKYIWHSRFNIEDVDQYSWHFLFEGFINIEEQNLYIFIAYISFGEVSIIIDNNIVTHGRDCIKPISNKFQGNITLDKGIHTIIIRGSITNKGLTTVSGFPGNYNMIIRYTSIYYPNIEMEIPFLYCIIIIII